MADRFAIVFLATALLAFPAAAQVDRSPSVTILETQEVQSILGREVRSTADENMGELSTYWSMIRAGYGPPSSTSAVFSVSAVARSRSTGRRCISSPPPASHTASSSNSRAIR